MFVRRSDRQKWGLKEGQFPFHGHTSFKALLLEPETVLCTPTTVKNTSHTLNTHFQTHSFLDKVTRAVSPGVLCSNLYVKKQKKIGFLLCFLFTLLYCLILLDTFDLMMKMSYNLYLHKIVSC